MQYFVQQYVKEVAVCLQKQTPTVHVGLLPPLEIICPPNNSGSQLFASAHFQSARPNTADPAPTALGQLSPRALTRRGCLSVIESSCWESGRGARQFALLNNLYHRQSGEEIEQFILKRYSVNNWSMYRSFKSTRQRLIKTRCRLSRKGT